MDIFNLEWNEEVLFFLNSKGLYTLKTSNKDVNVHVIPFSWVPKIFFMTKPKLISFYPALISVHWMNYLTHLLHLQADYWQNDYKIKNPILFFDVNAKNKASPDLFLLWIYCLDQVHRHHHYHHLITPSHHHHHIVSVQEKKHFTY